MTTYLNTYKAPESTVSPDVHKDTPVEQYDFNYAFEVTPLKSNRVELRPYVPSLHAQLLFDGVRANPEILKWLGTTEWQSLSDTLVWSEKTCRAPTSALFYAVFTGPLDPDAPPVPPEEWSFAGVMGIIDSSYVDSTAEIGWIMIMKPYQRTHVLTHAAGLCMHRILDLPEQGGLGLRRCQWHTNVLNDASKRAALRLGYSHEGITRAQRVLHPSKIGVRPGRPGTDRADWPARDNWWASVIWEEWDDGVRDHVDQLMARSK